MRGVIGVEYWYMPEPTKKCVKSYSTIFRLYSVSVVRLYMICPCCGCEFDYYCFYGRCPYCDDNPNNDNSNNNNNPNDDNDSDDPPQPGFVFLPELLLEDSPLALFPELAFYP
jgi:hypothetical protein